MELPVRDQIKYWSIAAAVFLGTLYLLGDVILPFVLAMAIAYLLDPIADKLETWGLSRIGATTLITIVAALLFIVTMLAIIPALIRQATDLVATAPQLFERLQGFLTERFPDLLDENSQIRKSLLQIGETIQSRGGSCCKPRSARP